MDKPQLVTRSEALSRGIGDADLARLCTARQWQRLSRGHYVTGDCANISAVQRHFLLIRAITDVAASGAVASFVSAAVLHGIDVWNLDLGKVHVTRNRRAGARTGRHIVVHAGSLQLDEIAVVDHILVTSADRAVADLARTVPFEEAVAVGDSALRCGLVTREQLAEQLRRARRRPGARAAARVFGLLDGRSESVGESRSRLALAATGLPAPELQASVFSQEGRLVGRVDFLFPGLGVIGEFDGMIKYQKQLRGTKSVEEVVVAEKLREDQLRELGWMVVRWTWHDLAQPQRLAARIRAAAGAAAHTRRLGSWTALTSHT